MKRHTTAHTAWQRQRWIKRRLSFIQNVWLRWHYYWYHDETGQYDENVLTPEQWISWATTQLNRLDKKTFACDCPKCRVNDELESFAHNRPAFYRELDSTRVASSTTRSSSSCKSNPWRNVSSTGARIGTRKTTAWITTSRSSLLCSVRSATGELFSLL